MDSIVAAAIITVSGWGITHVLTLRAQRKKFLDDINNNARIDISKAIREYQDWLNQIESYFRVLEFKFKMLNSTGGIDWDEEYGKFQEIIKQPLPNSWNYLLEEYRILFPETAKVRAILSRRQHEINDAIRWFHVEFWLRFQASENLIHNRLIIFNTIWKWLDYVSDQVCMTIDLQIYLQNKVLNKITGHHVPLRNPTLESVPRVIMGADRELIIVDGTGNEIKHCKQPFSPVDYWQYQIDSVNTRY